VSEMNNPLFSARNANNAVVSDASGATRSGSCDSAYQIAAPNRATSTRASSVLTLWRKSAAAVRRHEKETTVGKGVLLVERVALSRSAATFRRSASVSLA